VPTGTGYGTVVHAILATASPDDSRERLMHLARLAESDTGVMLSDEWRNAAVDSVARALRESTVIKTALAAAESWRELPFTVAVNGVVIDGVIDLLYIDGEGRAVIVDFKTDVELSGDALTEYKRQLAIYAIGIKSALGTETADSVLVQVRPDTTADHHLGPLTELQAQVRAEIGR
jgi:ATP-dependent exoDNAse (exonuclease V) beta subunit